MSVTSGEVSSAVELRSGDVPAHADGLQLIGEMAGSGYRTPPSLVRRGDGQTIQLTTLLYVVLESIDGQSDYETIARRASEATGRMVSAANVQKLVDSKLRPLGLLRKADGSQPALKKTNPILSLRCRYVVTDPERTRRITAPFALLFHPIAVVVVLAAFVLVCRWTLFDRGLAAATHDAFDRPGLLLAVFAISVVSAGFHEFGHAAAARYGGATPGAMGVGLYVVWPAFYTDVTDSYRLARGGRLRTDLGGLYFNAITAVVMFGVWRITGWEALLLIIPTQILQMIQQLSPLLRFDGYHLLADVTGVPDLYHRIKPALLRLVPFRRREVDGNPLKRWVTVVVTAWVLVVTPLLALSTLMMVLIMPRLAASAWASMSEQWSALRDDFMDADIVGVLANVLSILALVIPVAGIVYIVGRLVRKTVANVMRATKEHPVRRFVADAVAVVVLVALFWAWWPTADRYRPVQAYEPWTVDAVLSSPSDPETGLTEGRESGARTIWPTDADGRLLRTSGGELPTREHPILALVMIPAEDQTSAPVTPSTVPSEGSTSQVATSAASTTTSTVAAGTRAESARSAPAWVFPFDRPLPPAEGDNQAFAVNTQDGTVVYDVAFALVWVKDGETLNVNEAYAAASCTDCAAVAVGFQVVLVIGQANVAVPQNLSVAVNYACVRCLTYALANQLVVSLPGELSASTVDELNVLWEEIRRFGEQIDQVPLSELQSRLNDYERRILEIVGAEAERPEDPTSSSEASKETTGTEGTDVTMPPTGVTNEVAETDDSAATDETAESTPAPGSTPTTRATQTTAPSQSPVSSPSTSAPSSSSVQAVPPSSSSGSTQPPTTESDTTEPASTDAPASTSPSSTTTASTVSTSSSSISATTAP